MFSTSDGLVFDFVLPRNRKAGRVGLLRDLPGCGPVDGPEDVMVSLFHDNGDGTTSEVVIWSRGRRAWARWLGPRGGEVIWCASPRDALYSDYMGDEAVAELEEFFRPDPWEWLLAARVMEG
jgi:hypothetical protein